MKCLVPFIAVLLAVVVTGLWGCASEPSAREGEVGNAYRNLREDVEFVGMDACRSCHPDKFETFSQAQMGRSFKPALLKHSAANFDNPPPVYDEVLDLYYQAFHRGSELFIMEYRLADGDTVHKRVEKIDYIVGSGQHTNSHIMEVNGYLFQMPMTWYAQDGKWDLAPKFAGGNNYRFERPITEPCMTCHNAIPAFIEGSENRFAEVPHGIDCERCHGPGELHVEEKLAGKIVDVATEIDYSIVNPGKLPLDLQFDVCQRCHMQGATVYKEGMGPRDFRPGMPLDDVLNVFWPRFTDSTRHFIMASHPDRMQMSECFIGSHREGSGFEPMTCVTCHDPHVPIEALGADHYRDVCQSCHVPRQESDLLTTRAESDIDVVRSDRGNETSAITARHSIVHPAAQATTAGPGVSAGVCTEDLAVRMEVENNCVQCHMPVSGSADIPHVRVTDHYIRAVSKTAETDDELPTGREFVGLVSLIDDDPTEREMAEGYMTYFEEIQNHPGFLDSAQVHLDRARAEESLQDLAPSLVRLYHLKEDYDATVRLSREINRELIDDSWTLYRIGEAYHTVGDLGRAVLYLEDAVALSPDHPRFLNELGTALTDAGRLNEALDAFNRVLEANPVFAQAYNNRGFVHILMRDFVTAEQDFRRALELSPDAEQALANLASLYLNTNRKSEAMPYARRLLELYPQTAAYHRLWDLLQ